MQDRIDLDLLTKEQAYGKLTVLKKYDMKAAATDLAIATGILIDKKYNTYSRVSDGDCLTGRAGSYFTKDFYTVDGRRICAIDYCGEPDPCDSLSRNVGIRPVIKIDDVSKNILSKSSDFVIKKRYTIEHFKVVEFGEYPQMVEDLELQIKLEELFLQNVLKETGKTYTFDNSNINNIYAEFSPIIYDEYEYNGCKYIRLKLNLEDSFFRVTLSNGREYKNGDYVWIKIEPISWLIDEESKLLISKKCLVAGIRFDDKEYDGRFSKTKMKKYLDTYMSKEIMPSRDIFDELWNKVELSREKWNKRRNVFKFEVNAVSEEDIIKGSIESNIPVFLHGPSSEGKSARVLEIDKDATIIYLANESPDTINGKSVYNEKNNEMIDIKPSWLVKLEEKCKDGKLHILFFDEITNAFPRVQGIVFNIILNKEVNGKWKLPDNARIVAAGNEMEDSLSANELSEPLFNRFAHVYIKTTTESWLKWASVHNIHPAIYSFIAYKNGSVLRSKYDGKKVNADPRKWEMASKMLYKTNNPSMLRSLVGEDITKEFFAFCSSRVITLEDVLSDNYTNEDIENLNTAEKYATIMGLCMVDENNIRKVREFIKNMNSELLKVFDNLWANTEDRLEILNEIEFEKELIK